MQKTERASNHSNLAKRLNQCNRKSVMFGGGEREGGRMGGGKRDSHDTVIKKIQIRKMICLQRWIFPYFENGLNSF